MTHKTANNIDLAKQFAIAAAYAEAAPVLRQVKKMSEQAENKLELSIHQTFCNEINTAFIDVRTNIKAPGSKRNMVLSISNKGDVILSDGDKNLSSTLKEKGAKNRGEKELSILKNCASLQGLA